jgi:hypothetical protein
MKVYSTAFFREIGIFVGGFAGIGFLTFTSIWIARQMIPSSNPHTISLPCNGNGDGVWCPKSQLQVKRVHSHEK